MCAAQRERVQLFDREHCEDNWRVRGIIERGGSGSKGKRKGDPTGAGQKGVKVEGPEAGGCKGARGENAFIQN